MQRLEVPAKPRREPLVDAVTDAFVPCPCVFAGRIRLGVEYQRVHLRPSRREGQPVVVPRPVAGQRRRDRLQQPVEPATPVGPRVDRDAGPRPRLGDLTPARVRNRQQRAFQKEVVDVDPHVGMVERQLGRAGERRCVARRRLAHSGRPGRQAVQKERPPLLQEREERVAVGNDLRQGPRPERGLLLQRPDEMALHVPRQPQPAVVQLQQDAEQVRRLLDRLGRDTEHVAKRELPRPELAERPLGRLLGLGRIQGVEIARVHPLDDRPAQPGEQIVEAERQPSTRPPQVVGNHVLVSLSGERRDHVREITPVATRAIARLVEEAERDAVIQRDHLEAAGAERLDDARLREQAVGIVHDGEARDARRELAQDLVAPPRRRGSRRSVRPVHVPTPLISVVGLVVQPPIGASILAAAGIRGNIPSMGTTSEISTIA